MTSQATSEQIKLDAVQSEDFSEKSISELLTLQHEQSQRCAAIGLKSSSTEPRKSFRNRQDALLGVRRLDAALRADDKGDRKMAEAIVGASHTVLTELVPGILAGFEQEAGKDGSEEEQPSSGSPGLDRLRRASNAEALRNETVAQGQEAIRKVAAERQTKAEKEKTVAKTSTKKKAAPAAETKKTPAAKAPATKTKAAASAARGSTRSLFNPDDKITLVNSVKDNPKRAGSQAHADYALYRDGMKVASYIEKVGDPGRARANLRWDAKQGFIKIG